MVKRRSFLSTSTIIPDICLVFLNARTVIESLLLFPLVSSSYASFGGRAQRHLKKDCLCGSLFQGLLFNAGVGTSATEFSPPKLVARLVRASDSSHRYGLILVWLFSGIVDSN